MDPKIKEKILNEIKFILKEDINFGQNMKRFIAKPLEQYKDENITSYQIKPGTEQGFDQVLEKFRDIPAKNLWGQTLYGPFIYTVSGSNPKEYYQIGGRPGVYITAYDAENYFQQPADGKAPAPDPAPSPTPAPGPAPSPSPTPAESSDADKGTYVTCPDDSIVIEQQWLKYVKKYKNLVVDGKYGKYTHAAMAEINKDTRPLDQVKGGICGWAKGQREGWVKELIAAGVPQEKIGKVEPKKNLKEAKVRENYYDSKKMKEANMLFEKLIKKL